MSPISHFVRLPAHALALMVAITPAAVAQIGDYDPALTFPGLSQGALDSMHAAAAKLAEGRPIGTVEKWASPDGTMSGEVKLLHKFDSHNMPCGTVEYTIGVQGTLSASYPSHYILNWCRLPDGVWKIVPVPTPS